MFAHERCSVHPARPALSFCQCCKDFFCEECLTEAADYYYCLKPACIVARDQAIADKQQAFRDLYSQWFCDECIDHTEDTPSGKRLADDFKKYFDEILKPGIAVRLIGRKNHCPRCGSVEASAWMCIFFIPIFRVARYRVVWLGRDSLVTLRLKPQQQETAHETIKA